MSGNGKRGKILVVGGGISGITAAIEAAEAGCEVVLVEKNAYLGGRSDIYDWLEHVLPRLVHLHAKDISVDQGAAERGRVLGTAVGCACGDGVVNWERVVAIADRAPRDIVFSVECGTVEQAERSYAHLSTIVG